MEGKREPGREGWETKCRRERRKERGKVKRRGGRSGIVKWKGDTGMT